MSTGDETHRPRRCADIQETVRESAADRDRLRDPADTPVEIKASAGPGSGGVASYREFRRADGDRYRGRCPTRTDCRGFL